MAGLEAIAHLLGDAEIQVLAGGEIPNAAPVKVWMSEISAGEMVSIPSTSPASILLGACPCIPQGCEEEAWGGGHQPLWSLSVSLSPFLDLGLFCFAPCGVL